MDRDAKVLGNMLANQIQQYIKRRTHNEQVGDARLVQHLKINQCNLPYQQIRREIIISIMQIKYFSKIQHPLIIKSLKKPEAIKLRNLFTMSLCLKSYTISIVPVPCNSSTPPASDTSIHSFIQDLSVSTVWKALSCRRWGTQL